MKCVVRLFYSQKQTRRIDGPILQLGILNRSAIWENGSFVSGIVHRETAHFTLPCKNIEELSAKKQPVNIVAAECFIIFVAKGILAVISLFSCNGLLRPVTAGRRAKPKKYFNLLFCNPFHILRIHLTPAPCSRNEILLSRNL